jgi:hypothetical protein
MEATGGQGGQLVANWLGKWKLSTLSECPGSSLDWVPSLTYGTLWTPDLDHLLGRGDMEAGRDHAQG